MELTRYEQEVVINFNADEDMATLYSANPAWIRKLDALVKEFPNVFRIKRCTEVSKTYELPKKYVRIGKPREVSAKQRNTLEKMRDLKRKKAVTATRKCKFRSTGISFSLQTV